MLNFVNLLYIYLFIYFQDALSLPSCSEIYLTRIDKVFESDSFFPNFEPDFENIRYLT